MNKKGFVLVEAIITSVFVLGLFAFIIANVLPIIGDYDKERSYDTIESIYDAHMIQKMLLRDDSTRLSNLLTLPLDDGDKGYYVFEGNSICNYVENANYCKTLLSRSYLDVKKIVLTTFDTTYLKEEASNFERALKEYIEWMPTYDNVSIPMYNCERRLIIMFNDGRITNVQLLSDIDKIDLTKNVIYNNNGGSGCLSMAVDVGEPLGTLCVPTREDYAFDGWFTDTLWTTEVTSSTLATNYMILYARWRGPIPKYTVTFNSNGGSAVSSQSIQEGTYAIEPVSPTKEDYTFAGWYSDETLTSAYNFNSQINEDVTLYAKWTSKGVAKIGTSYYSALGDAITAVQSNVETTITLLSNTSPATGTSFDIGTGKNIKLNLNGYTITDNDTNVIRNYGTLYVYNGTITSSTSNGAAINNEASANLTIDNLRIIVSSSVKGQGIYNDNGATLRIKGNTYISTVSTNRPSVHNKQGGTVIVESATIISENQQGIQNESTTANSLIIGIQDGIHNKDLIVIQGKTYGVETSSNISVYDGVLKGVTDSINNKSKITGKESSIAEFTTTEVIDGVTYKVLYYKYIAQIGTTNYPTLQGALDAAPSNTETTIKLLDDTTPPASTFFNIESGKNIKLNLNGHTITDSGSNIIKNFGTLYIYNGTITSSAAAGAAINNEIAATMTVDNVRIIMTTLDKGQGLFNKKGSILTIKGNTYISTNSANRPAVHNKAGILTIESATIISSNFDAIANEEATDLSGDYGTLTIGIKDGTHNVNNIIVQGTMHGINTGAAISVYDGVIKGITDSINDKTLITDKESGTSEFTTTETINSNTYKVLYYR